MDYVSELREFCLIRWKFGKVQNGIEKFCCKFRNKCVRLSRITFVAERFGLFAVRLPSLSWGKNGLWECGITFDIFTHVFHGSSLYLQNHNVINTTVRPEKENMCTSKALHMHIVWKEKKNRHALVF